MSSIFNITNDFEYKALLGTLTDMPEATTISQILNSFSDCDRNSIDDISSYYFFHKMLIEKYRDFYYCDAVYPAIITAKDNFCIRLFNCWNSNDNINELKNFFIKHPDSIDLLISKIPSFVGYEDKSFALEIIREVSISEKQIEKAIKFYNNDFEV